MKITSSIFVFFIANSLLFSQNTDSLTKNRVVLPKILINTDSNLTFNGAKINSEIDNLFHSELKVGGYVSTYFSIYD